MSAAAASATLIPRSSMTAGSSWPPATPTPSSRSTPAAAACSGRPIPIADDVKLTHLLGVAKDRLVATGNRVLLFDVKTGKLVHAWPDSAKSLEGYGRGLLAGDFIYWPTTNEIQVLDQRTALRAEPPIKLFETYHTKGGNLVAGDGYLIVAQRTAWSSFARTAA